MLMEKEGLLCSAYKMVSSLGLKKPYPIFSNKKLLMLFLCRLRDIFVLKGLILSAVQGM